MTNHCDWCEDVIARNDLKENFSATNKFNLFCFLFICALSPCWCGHPEAVSMAIIDEDNDETVDDFDK